MNLPNLVGISLERITPDLATLKRLRESASRSLQDAQLPNMSPENRFDLSYKAIMQLANLALQASGYRTLTSKSGHHQTMIQTLTLTIGLDPKLMIVLDGLRKQRNIIDYSGDIVSESMANDAIMHAKDMIRRIDEWLGNRA